LAHFGQNKANIQPDPSVECEYGGERGADRDVSSGRLRRCTRDRRRRKNRQCNDSARCKMCIPKPHSRWQV
jgi:hypothetical protein